MRNLFLFFGGAAEYRLKMWPRVDAAPPKNKKKINKGRRVYQRATPSGVWSARKGRRKHVVRGDPPQK